MFKRDMYAGIATTFVAWINCRVENYMHLVSFLNYIISSYNFRSSSECFRKMISFHRNRDKNCHLCGSLCDGEESVQNV